MAAWRVHRINERLEADLTEKFLICVVGVVVEVVLARLVALSAAVAHDDVTHASDLEAAGFFQAGSPRESQFSHVCALFSLALSTRYTH